MSNPIQITTNYDRAVETATAAVNMLEENVYPFNIQNLRPDTIVPERVELGSKQHALFLFFACGWDSMEISERVYERVRTLASKIDLTEILTMTKERLTHTLTEAFGTGIETAISSPVETMHSNSKKLLRYDGDPSKLKADTIEKTIKNIEQFTQYGSEKAALLTKNFVRFGIWDFSEFEIPIKIDRHALKISIGNRAITFPKETETIRYDRFTKTLRRLYNQVTEKKRISAIKLDDAMWGIGSKLCRINKRSYCDTECSMDCGIRPYLDSTTTMLHLKKDTREQTRSLFSI